MKWRDDRSGRRLKEFPTISMMVIAAEDFIKKECLFTLTVRHVIIFDGHSDVKGFNSLVRSEGSSCSGKAHPGENDEAYQKALAEGEADLKRMVTEMDADFARIQRLSLEREAKKPNK